MEVRARASSLRYGQQIQRLKYANRTADTRCSPGRAAKGATPVIRTNKKEDSFAVLFFYKFINTIQSAPVIFSQERYFLKNMPRYSSLVLRPLISSAIQNIKMGMQKITAIIAVKIHVQTFESLDLLT